MIKRRKNTQIPLALLFFLGSFFSASDLCFFLFFWTSKIISSSLEKYSMSSLRLSPADKIRKSSQALHIITQFTEVDFMFLLKALSILQEFCRSSFLNLFWNTKM